MIVKPTLGSDRRLVVLRSGLPPTWAQMLDAELQGARAALDVISTIDIDKSPVPHAVLLEFMVACRKVVKMAGIVWEEHNQENRN
jgi:hypothetical protein